MCIVGCFQNNAMKKLYRIICFMSIFFWANQSISQNQKAISEHAIWCTEYFWAYPVEIYSKIYKSSGDTTINGLDYIKLFSAPGHRIGADTYHQDGPFTYSYAFRNDTSNRAYIFPADDTIEHLWYDFNLEIGDTLPLPPDWYSLIFGFVDEPAVVTGIDSILFCNEYHKMYKFYDDFSTFPSLIQGVGFSGDLINLNGIYFESGAGLLFFCSDTVLSNCCFTVSVNEEAENEIPVVVVSPNPVNNVLSATFDRVIYIEIFNMQGQNIKTVHTYGLSSINLGVSDLSTGLYFIKAVSDKGISVTKFLKE